MLATLGVKMDEAAVRGLPMNAAPAGSVTEARGARECVVEPKMDGWRVLAYVAEDGVRFFTRSGKRVPTMVRQGDEIRAVFPVGTWLDGEAVAFSVNEAGQVVHSWGRVQSVLGSAAPSRAALDSLTFVVFDLLSHGTLDIRALPMRARRDALEQVFASGSFVSVVLSVQMPAVEEAHEALIAQGFEGCVVKALDAPYASGKRGPAWRKVKATDDVDAVVMGFKDGEGSFTGLIGSIVFGQHDANGVLVERGRCSGMDLAMRREFSEDRAAWVGQVFTLRHNGVMPASDETPYGAFRHPVFLRLRPDRAAADVSIHDR